MKLALALAPLLCGCDVLFGLRVVEHQLDAPDRCKLADNFDDNRIAPQWHVDDSTQTSVLVTEKNGRLDLQLFATAMGYNALSSVDRYDITGKTLRATAFPMSQAGHVETYMQVAIDDQTTLFMHSGVGNMTFGTVLAGIGDAPYVPYEESKHRFWQIRHDPVAGVAYFEVSGDGVTFSVGRTVVLPVSLASVQIRFVAGTYSIGNPAPGSAQYDDVSLCDPL